jgi:hypothetical protein
MRKDLSPSRPLSLPSVLGLIAASVLCLCGGSLLAVSREGLLRLLFGAAGFASYVFFFAHALRALGVPRVLAEIPGGPDGEVRKDTIVQQARKTEASDRTRVLTAAA